MRGAGGTEGGIGQFFLGLAMLCTGIYLMLSSIAVTSSFGFDTRLYGFTIFNGYYGVTSGMVMFPFAIGVGMIFFNGGSILGWLLAAGSLIALVAGVVASLHFSLRTMSAFELITIVVLAAGGLGLFLNSLRTSKTG